MRRSTVLVALGAACAPRPLLAQSAGAPYKLGLTIPLTGPYAATVAEYLPAFELGVADVNAAGGVKGRKLQLVVEDSQATPQAGIAGMRKLVQVDGVTVMLSLFTNVVTAQIPLAEQLQMPTVTVVEAAGVVDKAAYTFSHGTRVSKIDPLFRDYWKAHGYKRIYAFAGNSAQGQAMLPPWRDVARDAGVEFESALVNIGDIDFRGELARVKSYNPDGLLINTSGSSAETSLIRQARELGITQQFFEDGNFYTTHAWRMAIGPYAEGMIFGGSNVDVKGARDFVRAYRNRMGFLPGWAAAEMYDAVKIAAYGIEHGGSGSGTAIRDAIATMKGLPSSLGGKLTMGADHYTIIPSIGLWQVKRGTLVRI